VAVGMGVPVGAGERVAVPVGVVDSSGRKLGRLTPLGIPLPARPTATSRSPPSGSVSFGLAAFDTCGGVAIGPGGNGAEGAAAIAAASALMGDGAVTVAALSAG
jgi:hypothetical protein